jgi:membrane protein implicated in regulation of membrane protease activity
MDLQASTLWWVVAGTLVATEMASGSFFLLMLAGGAAAGALAAHAGLSFVGQLVLAAVIGGGAVALWRRRLRQRATGIPTNRNPDVHLDVGSTVHVASWTPQGTARVQFRGTGWDARHAGPDVPAPGEHVVRAIEGNRLVLERLRH